MSTRLGAVAAAAVILLLWGVVAVKHLRLTWPAPRVLPGTVSYGPYTYFKQPGCHSRRWWDRSGTVARAERAPRVGTLRSALVVGALPEYGPNRHSLNGYLLVPSGGCYVMYLTNVGG